MALLIVELNLIWMLLDDAFAFSISDKTLPWKSSKVISFLFIAQMVSRNCEMVFPANWLISVSLFRSFSLLVSVKNFKLSIDEIIKVKASKY